MEYGWKVSNDAVSFGSLSRDFHYASMLISEIMSENLGEVRRLLEVNNANPNTVVPERGAAALHILAGLENEDFSVVVTLMILLKRGGDPNVRTEEGLTPVHIAAMWGRCKVLEVLLSNGGDPFLLDHEMQLNAENYALREHQWKAYSILTTFSVIVDDEYRFAKYLDDDEASCSRLQGGDATSMSHRDSGVSKSQDETVTSEYNDWISDDCDWLRQTMKAIPLNASAINTINNHRRGTKIYQSPNEESDQEYESVDPPRLPKRNAKRPASKTDDEMYFCEFTESSYKSKTSTGHHDKTGYFSEFSGETSEAKEPNNKILCKMSRIFLFMLKKRHTYQRIK